MSLYDLEKIGWVANNFEDYHLFGYVGDREKLTKEIERKSLVRRFIEIFAPRLNIGLLFKALTNYDLVRVDPEKTLAREIINLVTEHENQRKLIELLKLVYGRAEKKGRYFNGVEFGKYGKKQLSTTSFNNLQDNLVTIEGQLLHRSAVEQFSPEASASLKKSDGNWLLSDFPPHGLQLKSKFNGKFLILTEDLGFTKTFEDNLPFNTELAWYPFVRVTGFFDATKIQAEIFPSLSISLVEYRRPRIFLEQRDVLVAFLDRELHGYGKRRNFLKAREDLLLFSYLLPLICKGSNLAPHMVDNEFAALISEYVSVCEGDLAGNLNSFYESIRATC